MLQIKDWLLSATKQLRAQNIDSAVLDCELILAHILDVDRTYLKSHDDTYLTDEQIKIADELINKRRQRTPVAYLIGYKYFYGRKFEVNEHTLTPRPESEDIIEILKSIIHHFPTSEPKLLDVGTGSGCLGVTAKLEFPRCNVALSDISSSALDVAEKNAQNLSARVEIIKSDLLQSINFRPNIIAANLPYVDKTWETSPETKYEPSNALFANDEGKELIKKLIAQASKIQSKDDVIILESDPQQHSDLIEFAQKLGYENSKTYGYAVLLAKN